MATLRVIDVVDRVETILKDQNTRWPRLELQDWINEAYLSIVLLRPDANSTSDTFTCVAGVRQSLVSSFPSATRLLRVVRNLSTGSEKGVVRHSSQTSIDDQLPQWPAADPTLDVEYFMFDPMTPKEFLVYPPAKAGAELEIIYSAVPTAHSLGEGDLNPVGGSSETIRLDDIYFTPIVDWVLYRAYSKDAEKANNEARAVSYYQAFNTAIGAKTQTDATVTPSAAKAV